ncbi:hypothetical protein R2APBS1_2812 [Rhodanobacter denitrificans]|uniref:Uncharacterized protein n=2 Tax=Rhodanobacter denitrificans TaxID=666685 RepID=M4NG12_9GAMM|nr:hypothetical protein R2APBS1_2812 [Rhodanobacter denitrificans]
MHGVPALLAVMHAKPLGEVQGRHIVAGHDTDGTFVIGVIRCEKPVSLVLFDGASLVALAAAELLSETPPVPATDPDAYLLRQVIDPPSRL